ncbi:hypothetical protein HPP92_000040 [Vanilla planifolia]|uniref:Histidine-containing phosphotransfer protein n=1 Tax=Vanilla planifolia TaxID=51239 RepID=A0A835RP94_VANPL|nr:hypothetical protein HPP92_000040 [Vanilla planifolia]
MAAFAEQQLDALVSGMYREGFLDEQFQQIRALDEGGSPDFLVEVIGLFCVDADRILTELTDLLNQPAVDFQKVDAYVHQLKGSSASCLHALDLAKQRFYELSKRLNNMIQLEQTVYAYKAGK